MTKNLPMVIEQPKNKTYKSPFDGLYDRMELIAPDSGMNAIEEEIMRRMFIPYRVITPRMRMGYG